MRVRGWDRYGDGVGAGREAVRQRADDVAERQDDEQPGGPSGVGQGRGGERGGPDEGRVVEHVVQRERPPAVRVAGVALDDGVDGDLGALRGEAEQGGGGEHGTTRVGEREHPLADRREQQAAGDPRVQAGARGERGRQDDREREPEGCRAEHGRERGEPLRGVGRVGEQVAGDEDARDEHDAVQEPVVRHDTERQPGGAARDEVAGALDETVQQDEQRGRHPGGVGLLVGAEPVPREAGGDDGGHAHGERGEDERRTVSRRARREHPAEHEPDGAADAVRGGAERRRHGVRGEQQPPLDDVRQRRGQRGQQEPVHGQHDEREHVDRGPDAGRHHHGRGRERQHEPHHVPDEQHLAAWPPVEQHARPRSDDRERRQQHRERGRDAPGGRRVLGGEEEQGREAHLEHAVGALADEPHRQEPAEPPQRPQRLEVRDHLHARHPRTRGTAGRDARALVVVPPWATSRDRPTLDPNPHGAPGVLHTVRGTDQDDRGDP